MTTPSSDRPAAPTTISILALHRGQLIAVSIIGIILGLIGLVFPTTTLLFVAILFGIFLVAAGIFRINASLITHNLPAGIRWLSAILGLLIVAAGVICLADPFQSLIVLAYLIGIGWIAAGISDVMAAIQGSVRPRWFGWVSGIIAILAGIVMFVLPALSLATFVLWASALLIVVSVAALLSTPRAVKVKEEVTPKL
ncbi:MAG TPA: DUF308 domain-containing protein [Galbitalea sp.]|jgi:uncharacterized membrane protein HdeD (DUF308 family)|nr:DUF308 domain-containing protein [Galbitalea sp.]